MMGSFAALDWVVVAAYLALMAFVGWWFSPRAGETATTQEYFLAGNQVPAWLAAVSVLSATQSAATFLGGPDYGYRGDLTYVGSILGQLIGAVVVARVLIPRFYAAGASTAYELLTRRFGLAATRWAGGMFLVGRVLAGGARVYLAAIAIAMVATGRVEAGGIVAAAAGLMVASFLFTFVGGLRAVMWNDLVQFVIYVGAALAVLAFLWTAIPAPADAIWRGLADTPDGVNKLRLFDWSTDLSRPFSLLAVVTGVALLHAGNAGLDQDTTQRLLACRDARTGARGLYLSVVATVPIVLVFVTIGLLLYVFYDRPDLMGGATAARAGSMDGETVNVFMHYILTEVPPGLRGLVTVGVAAAAVATTNSALNAMSSVAVQDFYRPWRERRRAASERHYVLAGRIGMAAFGCAMLSVAILSFYWQRAVDMPLLEFALQVMVFAYAGLLGVYIVAIFTRRGSTRSVVAALIAGFATVLLLQPALGLSPVALAFPFQLCLGTLVAALVAAVPAGRP